MGNVSKIPRILDFYTRFSLVVNFTFPGKRAAVPAE
jgi:hypothetical protein